MRSVFYPAIFTAIVLGAPVYAADVLHRQSADAKRAQALEQLQIRQADLSRELDQIIAKMLPLSNKLEGVMKKIEE